MDKYSESFKPLRIKKHSTFNGWIDKRDLAKILVRPDGKFFIDDRHLTIYDKHWYDKKCVLVKIELLGMVR